MSALLESLRSSMAIVDAAIADAAENSRSSQGMASLIKQRVDIAVKIAEESERVAAMTADTPDEELSDEELIQLQVADLCELPDVILDQVLAGVAAARPAAIARAYPRRLEVVGGRDVE